MAWGLSVFGKSLPGILEAFAHERNEQGYTGFHPELQEQAGRPGGSLTPHVSGSQSSREQTAGAAVASARRGESTGINHHAAWRGLEPGSAIRCRASSTNQPSFRSLGQ